ncbi:MAG TPA: ABC transporter ATP-binding protein [Clostridia bacterium]|nr:ABC transporter ATP-binding protein [Clostridia bacterium]
MNVIEINNLTKYYGRNKGIEDVTLSVREGEIFGFIGPNGAGKSTTIRLLLSLIYPTSGSATIFGRDCIRFGHEIRNDIGYLPSEVFYYDKMKVKDLLKYSASFFKGDHSARMKELADIMELDLNRRIDELSYGNKKKVGIVQGLLHEPKLIMLDEPTSGLDPLMQNKFFNLILEENKKGATVFFSSHILAEVQKMCNRVAIIRDGHIVKTEDIAILRKDTYKKVYVRTDKKAGDPSKYPGVSNVEIVDGEIRFLYKGDINQLLALVTKNAVLDLNIVEPDLEEVFMHYYQ